MKAALKEIWEWHHLLGGPRPFARRQRHTARQIVSYIIRAQQFNHYWNRRRILRSLPPSQLVMPECDGFLDASAFDPAAINAAVKQSHEIMRGFDFEAELAHMRPEVRQFASIQLNDKLAPDSPIMRLMLHPTLIRTLGDYMGGLPVVYNARIWYSPNREDSPGSSQRFHLDTQETRLVLMTVHLADIDEDSGPLVWVPADASTRLAKQIGYRMSSNTMRVPDKVVETHTESGAKLVRGTGPTGTVHMCDVARCFHYGSRKAPRPRLLLAIQYCTPFCFTLPEDWWNNVPFTKVATDPRYTKIERMVLGARG